MTHRATEHIGTPRPPGTPGPPGPGGPPAPSGPRVPEARRRPRPEVPEARGAAGTQGPRPRCASDRQGRRGPGVKGVAGRTWPTCRDCARLSSFRRPRPAQPEGDQGGPTSRNRRRGRRTRCSGPRRAVSAGPTGPSIASTGSTDEELYAARMVADADRRRARRPLDRSGLRGAERGPPAGARISSAFPASFDRCGAWSSSTRRSATSRRAGRPVAAASTSWPTPPLGLETRVTSRSSCRRGAALRLRRDAGL